MGKVILILALCITAACQSIPKSQFCDIAKPIRPTPEQVDQLTDAQVKELLAHNRKGQALCRWRP